LDVRPLEVSSVLNLVSRSEWVVCVSLRAETPRNVEGGPIIRRQWDVMFESE